MRKKGLLMQNTDDLFEALLEKEKEFDNLQIQYQQLLINNYLQKIKPLKVIKTIKHFTISTYHFKNIKLIICLETIGIMDYRVTLWCSHLQTSSAYFAMQKFNFKRDAYKYINKLKFKYLHNSIENIIKDQIQSLNDKICDLTDKILFLRKKKSNHS